MVGTFGGAAGLDADFGVTSLVCANVTKSNDYRRLADGIVACRREVNAWK